MASPKKPQDHAAKAQVAEATDSNELVTFEHNGISFTVAAKVITWRVMRDIGKNDFAPALEAILGAEQFETVLDWPVEDSEDFLAKLFEAVGQGNYSASPTS